MSDKGKFSGFNWHLEYHSTNKKKDKAANCIYLDEDRICNNKDSVVYLEKCFRASWCQLRTKSNDSRYTDETTVSKPKAKKKIISINCSLPKNCQVMTKNNTKIGTLIAFDKEKMYITVKFHDEHKYMYPSCFTDGYLTVSDELKQLIQKDIDNALWG